jgi:hypothetical protein
LSFLGRGGMVGCFQVPLGFSHGLEEEKEEVEERDRPSQAVGLAGLAGYDRQRKKVTIQGVIPVIPILLDRWMCLTNLHFHAVQANM